MVCGMELRHFLEKLEVSGSFFVSLCFRACLKKAFCKMFVTICGRFRPNEGAVMGYGNRIQAKCNAKWGVQIAMSRS